MSHSQQNPIFHVLVFNIHTVLCWEVTMYFPKPTREIIKRCIIPFSRLWGGWGRRKEGGREYWLPPASFQYSTQRRSIALHWRAIRWLQCRNRQGDHIALGWRKKRQQQFSLCSRLILDLRGKVKKFWSFHGWSLERSWWREFIDYALLFSTNWSAFGDQFRFQCWFDSDLMLYDCETGCLWK